jgi:hypothetical protein
LSVRARGLPRRPAGVRFHTAAAALRLWRFSPKVLTGIAIQLLLHLPPVGEFACE